jgi:hypothetical protein
MPLFEKSKQLSQSNPPPPRPGSTPPKFNPPDWTSSIYRPSRPQKPMIQKPLAPKPAPEKPKTIFEQKKDWRREEFINRLAKEPLSIKGRQLSFYERKKVLNEAFPLSRFSTYISDKEARQRLKELRREESRAKASGEKVGQSYVKKYERVGAIKKYVEKGTSFKGKY